MNTRFSVLCMAVVLLSVGPVRADDAADCDAGIARIAAEVAREHPKATADALKTALRVARREKGEREYDECLDAVADADKALKK